MFCQWTQCWSGKRSTFARVRKCFEWTPRFSGKWQKAHVLKVTEKYFSERTQMFSAKALKYCTIFFSCFFHDHVPLGVCRCMLCIFKYKYFAYSSFTLQELEALKQLSETSSSLTQTVQQLQTDRRYWSKGEKHTLREYFLGCLGFEQTCVHNLSKMCFIFLF